MAVSEIIDEILPEQLFLWSQTSHHTQVNNDRNMIDKVESFHSEHSIYIYLSKIINKIGR